MVTVPPRLYLRTHSPGTQEVLVMSPGHDRPSQSRHLSLVIDCDTCVARRTSACSDCVVTFLVRDEPDEAVIIDFQEARALRTLGAGGLVPKLRHRADL